MSLSVLTSFAIASLILAIAPGPDNIFVLTQSALYGVKKGIAVIIGLCLGILLQTLCLIVGVSAFISAVPLLMMVIKLAGVLYLSYLAYQALKASLALLKAPVSSHEADQTPSHSSEISYRKLISRGFIMNITNPKVQLFFLSFFPQFLPSSAQGLTLAFYMGLLGAIFCAATLLVFCSIAVFSGSLSSLFNTPSFNIKLNVCAALIFISLALYTLITLQA